MSLTASPRVRTAFGYGALRGLRTALQTLGATVGALQVTGLTSSLGRALGVAAVGALIAGVAAFAQNAGDYLSENPVEEEPEPERTVRGFGR